MRETEEGEWRGEGRARGGMRAARVGAPLASEHLALALSSPRGSCGAAFPHHSPVPTLKADDTCRGRPLAPFPAGAALTSGRRPAWQGHLSFRPRPPKSEVSAMQLPLELIGEPCSPEERWHCWRFCLLPPNSAGPGSAAQPLFSCRGMPPASEGAPGPCPAAPRSQGRARPGRTRARSPGAGVSPARKADTRTARASKPASGRGWRERGRAAAGRRARPRG